MTLLHQAAQKAVEAVPRFRWDQDMDVLAGPYPDGEWVRRADVIAALQQQPEPEAPIGWLYDWTHSSALGKPDEQFTGFTTDEAHARKHDSPRAVYAAPPALQHQEVPREPVAEAEKPFVWLPETYLTVGSGPDGWRFVFMHTDAIPPVNSIPLYRRAASPSTTRQQEVGNDSARLDWLEAWHDVAGKEHGYGDTGIALIVRVSDGFMVDSEFGGGTCDTLRQAVDKAMLAAAPSTPENADGGPHG